MFARAIFLVRYVDDNSVTRLTICVLMYITRTDIVYALICLCI